MEDPRLDDDRRHLERAIAGALRSAIHDQCLSWALEAAASPGPSYEKRRAILLDSCLGRWAEMAGLDPSRRWPRFQVFI